MAKKYYKVTHEGGSVMAMELETDFPVIEQMSKVGYTFEEITPEQARRIIAGHGMVDGLDKETAWEDACDEIPVMEDEY